VKTSLGLRFVALLCVVAVLLAVASPVAPGLSQAVLVPVGPILCEPPGFHLLRADLEAPHRAPFVTRGVPARAPPLA